MRTTIRTLMLMCLSSGCVLDAADDTELATTAQASTVLDNCAVGTAANALGTVSTAGDSYTRSDLVMDLIGTQRCDCIEWQGMYDSLGMDAAAAAAANAAYPKCRPEAIFQVTVTGSAHFEVFSEMTDKVHTQVDCDHSDLHMELWKSIGRGIWQRMWSGTETAHFDPPLNPAMIGRCPQTVGEASPSVPAGLYRVKAVATPAGEQGYGTIQIMGI
ncbi:MAG: hypothetical protein ABJE66_24980 [Deltaproteobacteria bacterium]